MSTPTPPSPAIDPSPLLSPRTSSGRRPALRAAARLLRGASGRRVMREPSMVVRETAAEQLEARQSDWAYSRPVVFLDVTWNFAFVSAAAGVLAVSRGERPSVPLRLWVVGYALQCALHVVCVVLEYRRRRRQPSLQGEGGSGGSRGSSGSGSPHWVEDTALDSAQELAEERMSFAKDLEHANTMFSFIWWIIGFYWVSAGGQTLTRDSPQLYWLCIVFLAFDVFFLVFCVALACVIGIAVCCCLPCIIAILYNVADQDGASDEDIRQLPKYKFRRIANPEKEADESSGPFGGIVTDSGGDQPVEHILSAEDAECCICLSAYDDGVDLRELPCGHHFHCACIDKWLYINATCPLCKYDILRDGSQRAEA